MGQAAVDIVRRKIIRNIELQPYVNNVVAIAIRRCHHTSFNTVMACLLFSDVNSDGTMWFEHSKMS